MLPLAEVLPVDAYPEALRLDPVAEAVRSGLSRTPRSLPPWLFYDRAGSMLFERITTLPEYYLTRTERALFERHAAEIVALTGPLTLVELGAGTASKTGVILRAAAEAQGEVLYQPIDVSPSVLEEAALALQAAMPSVQVAAVEANYVTSFPRLRRAANTSLLALYIGSSIGNFTPEEARAILAGLRAQMRAGDKLLLGADLTPGPGKSIARLLAAYDDAAGVTAAFNRNMLVRLNEELGADFQVDRFAHRAIWNAPESRIEMHLEARSEQTVNLPAQGGVEALTIYLAAGETIHTENSYKFTPGSLAALLADSGFRASHTFTDEKEIFSVTLADAV